MDAATGFANNEPIQLKNAGIDTVVLTVDAIVPLPGPGLVTGTATLKAKHDALAAFTKATLQAMDEITADPQKGLDATFAAGAGPRHRTSRSRRRSWRRRSPPGRTRGPTPRYGVDRHAPAGSSRSTS